MSKRDLMFEILKGPQANTQKEGFFSRLATAMRSARQPSDAQTPAEAPLTTSPQGRVIPLNGPTITIGVAVILLAGFCGVVVGWQLGWKKSIQDRSERSLSTIKTEDPEPDVLDLTSVGSSAVDSGDENWQTVAKSTHSGFLTQKFTRNVGKNYLIIARFGKIEKAERAGMFLQTASIAVTVEQSGKWYYLVSKAGFDLPDKEIASSAFKRRIRQLGVAYKKQPRTQGTDFSSCYYLKWSKKKSL